MERNHLKTELQSRIAEFCDNIEAVWSEIGVNESCYNERVQEVLFVIEQSCTGMIDEESNILQRTRDNVERARRDIDEITRALKLPPVKSPLNLPLMQLESFLESEAQSLRVLKQERMDKLNKSLKTAKDLCRELGVCLEKNYPVDEIPNESDLEKLRLEVENLKFMKVERVSQAEALRKEINDLYECLEDNPKDISRQRLGGDVASCLTVSALNDLESLRDRLLKQQATLEHRAETLRNQLEAIYTRLDLQMLQLQQFLHRHPTSKPSDIRYLEEELERCMELRRNNIEKFVINCRRELEQYWNCLYISEDAQMTRFKPFLSTTFSETLLELHEAELEKTKVLFDKSKPILDLFNQHSEVWAEFEDMERKANDPSRLLARGRGKGLLQEQRQRREIEKKLPKLEEKLQVAVGEWELNEGEPFLIFEFPILDYINWKKENFFEEKEAAKRAKHEEKEREKEHEMRYGTKPQATKRGAAALGPLKNGPKTPSKKGKLGTTMNTTNQFTKTSISNSSNKSRNVLLSATKPKQLTLGGQQQSAAVPRKGPVVATIRQPNFGLQQLPPKGLTAIGHKGPGMLNPGQKLKRRSLAHLQKKKTEPIGRSKLVAKENANMESVDKEDKGMRRSQRIQHLNQSRILSNVSHIVNSSQVTPNEGVECSLLHETYSAFSNRINSDLAASTFIQD